MMPSFATNLSETSTFSKNFKWDKIMSVAADRIPFAEMDPGDNHASNDVALESKFSQELKALEDIFKEFSSIIQDDEKEIEKQNETTEKEKEKNSLDVPNNQKELESHLSFGSTKAKKELQIEVNNILSEEHHEDRMNNQEELESQLSSGSTKEKKELHIEVNNISSEEHREDRMNKQKELESRLPLGSTKEKKELHIEVNNISSEEHHEDKMNKQKELESQLSLGSTKEKKELHSTKEKKELHIEVNNISSEEHHEDRMNDKKDLESQLSLGSTEEKSELHIEVYNISSEEHHEDRMNDQKKLQSQLSLGSTKEKKELHIEVNNISSEENHEDRMESTCDNFFSVSSYEQISFDKDRCYSSDLDEDGNNHDSVQSLSDLLKQPLDQLILRVHSDDDDDDIQSQRSSTIRDFPPLKDCSMYVCTFLADKFKEQVCTKESTSKISLGMLCNRPDPAPAKLEIADSKTDQSTLHESFILKSFEKMQSNNCYAPHEDIDITTTYTRSDSDKQDDGEPFNKKLCNQPDPIPAKIENVDSKTDQSTLNRGSILNSFEKTQYNDYYDPHGDIDVTTTYIRSDSDNKGDGEHFDEEREDDETLFLGLIPEEIEVMEYNLNIVSGIHGSPSQESSIPSNYTKSITNSPPSEDCSILMDREQVLDDISAVYTGILEEELYVKENFFKTLLGVLCNQPDPLLAKLEKALAKIDRSNLNEASTLDSFEKTQSNDNYTDYEDFDITTTYSSFDSGKQDSDKSHEKDKEILILGLVPEEIEVLENNLNVLSEVADEIKVPHDTEVFQPDIVDTDKTCLVIKNKDEQTSTNNASPRQIQFDRKNRCAVQERIALSPRQHIQDSKGESGINDSHKAMLIENNAQDVQLEPVTEGESKQLSKKMYPRAEDEKNPLKVNNSSFDDKLQISDESNYNASIKVTETVNIAKDGNTVEISVLSGTEIIESIEEIETVCDSDPLEANISPTFEEVDATRSEISRQLSKKMYPRAEDEKNPLKVNNSSFDDKLQISDESNYNASIKVTETVNIAKDGNTVEISVLSGTETGTEIIESIEEIETVCDSDPLEANISPTFEEVDVTRSEISRQLSKKMYPRAEDEKNPLKVNNSSFDDKLQISDESNYNANIKVTETVNIAKDGNTVEISVLSGTETGTEIIESIEEIETVCDSDPLEANISPTFEEFDATRSEIPHGITADIVILPSFSQESFESDDSEYISDCDEGYDPDYDSNCDSDDDSAEETMGIISEMIAVACHCRAETIENSEKDWMLTIEFDRTQNESISSMVSSSFTLESGESDCSDWENEQPGGSQDSGNSIDGSADKFAKDPNEEFSQALDNLWNPFVEVVLNSSRIVRESVSCNSNASAVTKESSKLGDSVDTRNCMEAAVEEYSQALATKKSSVNSQDTTTCIEDAVEECSQVVVGQGSTNSIYQSADIVTGAPNQEVSQALENTCYPYVEVILDSDPSGVYRESVSSNSNVSVATKESSENKDFFDAIGDTQKAQTFNSYSSGIDLSEMEDLIQSLSSVSTKEVSSNEMTTSDDERRDEKIMKGCTSKKALGRKEIVTAEFSKSPKIRRFNFYEPIAFDQNLLFARQKDQIFKEQENKDSRLFVQDADLVSISGSSSISSNLINRAPFAENQNEDAVLQIPVKNEEHGHEIGGRKVLTPRQSIHENDRRLQTEKPVTYGSPLSRGYFIS